MNIRISRPVCFSEIGQKDNQEDALYPHWSQMAAHNPHLGLGDDTQRVFVLCDGMGGHAHGEVASQCVARTVGSYVEEALSSMPRTNPPATCTMQQMRQFFDEALEQAYAELDRLDDESSDGPQSHGTSTMGTTLAFLAICSDGLLAAHIGDSRIYQFRPDEGIVFRTRDHSLVNELLLAGEITEEEARTHPRRNVITRAVQPHQDVPAKATFDELTDLRRGDVLMLSCDGVTEQVTDQALEMAIAMLPTWSLVDRVETLRRVCDERLTRDNYTCWAIEVKEVEQSGAGDAAPTRGQQPSACATPLPDLLSSPCTPCPTRSSAPLPEASQPDAHQAPTHHGWLLALLAALALACFVAGYLAFGRTSSASECAAPAAQPAPSEQFAPQTDADASDAPVQGTVTRQRRH